LVAHVVWIDGILYDGSECGWGCGIVVCGCRVGMNGMARREMEDELIEEEKETGKRNRLRWTT